MEVQFSAMKNKPPYALESVDNALRLLHMLRDEGRLRVSKAASELGCARSTAHRLLAMLVYRDFAIQDDSHTYLPGPALSAMRVASGPHLQEMRQVLLPYLEVLSEHVDESVNLVVRVGTQARFLATVEAHQALRVSDRRGTILPARHASGGKALLAELDESSLAEIYLSNDRVATDGEAEQGLSTSDFHQLCQELRLVREHGYALNMEATETGVCAIARCIPSAQGPPVSAISIAVPTVRFPPERIPRLAAELRHTTDRIRADLRL